jgi:hypothetical protein
MAYSDVHSTNTYKKIFTAVLKIGNKARHFGSCLKSQYPGD